MTEQSAAQKSKHLSPATILKLLLTLATVAYILWLAQPERVLGNFLAIDLRFLGLAILIKPLTDAIKIRKWQVLARVQIPTLSFWRALRSFYIGIALAVITPFAVGELARGAFTSEKKRLELSGLVLFDKILDLGTVAVYSLVGFALLSKHYLLATLALILYWLSLLALPTIFELLEKANYMGIGRFVMLERLIISIKAISPQLTLRAGALSLLYFVPFYLQAALLMRAYIPSFPSQAMLLFPIITLSTVLPITIGGVGIREGIAILLLQSYGIPEEVAFNTFFMHFVVANVLAGLIGAILFFLSTPDEHPTKVAAPHPDR